MRVPVALSSWMTSVPVMSDGIRSGVNWMRLNDSVRIRARRRDHQRLRQPRHADQQAVAAAEQRHVGHEFVCNREFATAGRPRSPLGGLGDRLFGLPVRVACSGRPGACRTTDEGGGSRSSIRRVSHPSTICFVTSLSGACPSSRCPSGHVCPRGVSGFRASKPGESGVGERGCPGTVSRVSPSGSLFFGPVEANRSRDPRSDAGRRGGTSDNLPKCRSAAREPADVAGAATHRSRPVSASPGIGRRD